MKLRHVCSKHLGKDLHGDDEDAHRCASEELAQANQICRKHARRMAAPLDHESESECESAACALQDLGDHGAEYAHESAGSLCEH